MNQTKNINVRMTDEEKKLIDRYSSKLSVPASTWMRMLVLKECKKMESKEKTKDTE